MAATSEYNYLKGFCKGMGLSNSTKAFSFILKQHGDQKRNDGSPYYVHPVKVASQLISLGVYHDDLKKLDVLITGALLHDVLEDTKATAEQITDNFNEEITSVVQFLTKTKDMSNEFYYDRIKENLPASIIKIADRCNNISTMAGVFDRARLQRYVDETNVQIKPLIRHVRDNNPDISHQIVNMSYHIKSVLSALERALHALVKKQTES